MASETDIWSGLARMAPAWPPDDTEESVVGITLHQTTITNLRWGSNEAARLYRVPGQPLPWQALSQTLLLGCRRLDGSAYRTLPDMFIYRRSIDPLRGSVTLAEDGPPTLIIEVLSDATSLADLDLERGKGYSYAQAGVGEYLALDPTGAFVSDGGRAWRLVGGVYQPWQPDGQGRWQSEQLPIAFGLEGLLATVYTRDGRRLHREGEVEEALAQRDEALAQQAAEIEELRRQLRKLRGE